MRHQPTRGHDVVCLNAPTRRVRCPRTVLRHGSDQIRWRREHTFGRRKVREWLPLLATAVCCYTFGAKSLVQSQTAPGTKSAHCMPSSCFVFSIVITWSSNCAQSVYTVTIIRTRRIILGFWQNPGRHSTSTHACYSVADFSAGSAGLRLGDNLACSARPYKSDKRTSGGVLLAVPYIASATSSMALCLYCILYPSWIH